jgi:hypothetical protein
MEEDSQRRWDEQERMRVWKANLTRSRLFVGKKEKDKGLLEDIALERNEQRRRSKMSESMGGARQFVGRPPLPKEDRAIYNEASEKVFFWG